MRPTVRTNRAQATPDKFTWAFMLLLEIGMILRLSAIMPSIIRLLFLFVVLSALIGISKLSF